MLKRSFLFFIMTFTLMVTTYSLNFEKIDTFHGIAPAEIVGEVVPFVMTGSDVVALNVENFMLCEFELVIENKVINPHGILYRYNLHTTVEAKRIQLNRKDNYTYSRNSANLRFNHVLC